MGTMGMRRQKSVREAFSRKSVCSNGWCDRQLQAAVAQRHDSQRQGKEHKPDLVCFTSGSLRSRAGSRTWVQGIDWQGEGEKKQRNDKEEEAKQGCGLRGSPSPQ